MPDCNPGPEIAIDVSIEARFVRITVVGVVIPGDLLNSLVSLQESADFKANLGMLWDMRAALPGDSSPADVRQVAEVARGISSQSEPTRVAFVGDTPLLFGMARMAASYAETDMRTAQVFRDIAAAENWLLE